MEVYKDAFLDISRPSAPVDYENISRDVFLKFLAKGTNFSLLGYNTNEYKDSVKNDRVTDSWRQPESQRLTDLQRLPESQRLPDFLRLPDSQRLPDSLRLPESQRL